MRTNRHGAYFTVGADFVEEELATNDRRWVLMFLSESVWSVLSLSGSVKTSRARLSTLVDVEASLIASRPSGPSPAMLVDVLAASSDALLTRMPVELLASTSGGNLLTLTSVGVLMTPTSGGDLMPPTSGGDLQLRLPVDLLWLMSGGLLPKEPVELRLTKVVDLLPKRLVDLSPTPSCDIPPPTARHVWLVEAISSSRLSALAAGLLPESTSVSTSSCSVTLRLGFDLASSVVVDLLSRSCAADVLLTPRSDLMPESLGVTLSRLAMLHVSEPDVAKRLRGIW